MQSKTASRRAGLVAVLTGLVALSPVFLFYFFPNSFDLSVSRQILSDRILFIENTVTPPEQAIVGLPASSARMPDGQVGRPVRLKIPKINVDSGVEYVGLAPDGAMDVPKEGANTAWFELGQRPGASGSAVIAGHYGFKNKKGSVFDDLHKLRKGDKIYIEDDKGVIISFVVRESRRYKPDADSSGVFSSNDGKAHLNLVTCEGEWNKSTQQYSKRLVVFTDRETE